MQQINSHVANHEFTMEFVVDNMWFATWEIIISLNAATAVLAGASTISSIPVLAAGSNLTLAGENQFVFSGFQIAASEKFEVSQGTVTISGDSLIQSKPSLRNGGAIIRTSGPTTFTNGLVFATTENLTAQLSRFKEQLLF